MKVNTTNTNATEILLRRLFEYVETAPKNPLNTELSAFMHNDIKWTFPKSSGGFLSGTHEGLGAIATLLSVIFSKVYNSQKFKFEIQHVFGNDEFSAARYRVIAESAKGLAYENDYALLAQIKDGKIIALWEYLDTYSAGEQLQLGKK